MTPGSTAAALRRAADCIAAHQWASASDALHVAAEHLAGLEHAFRLRSGTIERLRVDVETLKGQLLLIEHWMREREREDDDD